MRLPNLLASKQGRLTAFFFLYITEGIPLGFTATAVATQMRRQGLGPAEIGSFVAMLYFPWAWKWAVAPFVDLIYSDRFGRRRLWIVVCQVLMAATLLAGMPIDFVQQIKLFTLLIFVHNIFGATQDVAIDALACQVLHEDERGLANGLMFGGAYLGQAMGGAGVLFLTPHVGFNATFLFVAGWILAVTLLVAIPLREVRGPARSRADEKPLGAAFHVLKDYVVEALRAFFGTSASRAGLVFALLPAGAYSLSLALQSNLAVELGLDDSQVAWLNLSSTIIAGSCCVIGGFLSDRFGRRRMLAFYVLGTAIPTFTLAALLDRYGWIMPVDPTAPDRLIPPQSLVYWFWIATLSFSVFQGLLYGTRTALFMDICTPAVAATQFTAYMAALNLVISMSATWQGKVIEAYGYPAALTIDGAIGMLCLLLLPWMRKPVEDG